MKLTLLDILIICVYLASTIVIGLVLKKRAQQDKTTYMLGGNKLPLYMLSLSNASGMFDISGTMWLVTLAFVYGLPSAISEFVPVGFMGLLLAGLLAAFMSTFAGTLNAAQAYIVNDIYLKYLKPKAFRRQISRTNYPTGITVVGVSVVFGFFALDVNSVLQWIVPALIFPYILDTLDLYYFPLIMVISLVGALIGTYASPATDEKTLKSFYKNVKPWGFWRPIHEKVIADDPSFKRNSDPRRDMFNVLVGIIAQTALVIFPIYIILKRMLPLGISIAIIVFCFIIMKRTWWDRLPVEKPILK